MTEYYGKCRLVLSYRKCAVDLGLGAAAETAAAARKLRREILSFIPYPPGVRRRILPHTILFYIIPPFPA